MTTLRDYLRDTILLRFKDLSFEEELKNAKDNDFAYFSEILLDDIMVDIRDELLKIVDSE